MAVAWLGHIPPSFMAFCPFREEWVSYSSFTVCSKAQQTEATQLHHSVKSMKPSFPNWTMHNKKRLVFLSNIIAKLQIKH